MRELFPGYFKENVEDLKLLWESCLFVFDANILLNFYRYSDSTKQEFFNLLEKIQDRVWLPHRVVEEYLKNRLLVIGKQEESYDETTKLIETLKKGLDNARQHPFVSKVTMRKTNEMFELLSSELSENKAIHTKRISDDNIKKAILSIFEGKVGKPYSNEELGEIIAKGEERYKQKIPPGFKDGGKLKLNDSEIFSDKCKKYGDLIIWNQIIDKSIDSGKGIILVTDDKKEDWWEIFKGKIVGSRPELVKEFRDRACNTFHMYQAARFLELARENLGGEVSEEFVEEIKEVSRRNIIAYKNIESADYTNKQKKEIAFLENDLANEYQEFQLQNNQIKELESARGLLSPERQRLMDYQNKILHEGQKEEIQQALNSFLSFDEAYNSLQQCLESLKMENAASNQRIMNLKNELLRRKKRMERDQTLAESSFIL